MKKNRFDQQPIRIISIVKELARIFKSENLEAIRVTSGSQARNLDLSEELIQIGVQLLEKYFYQVENIFSEDWGKADSLLMCANYIGAFIRLLETFINNGFTVNQIQRELNQIKLNIVENYKEGRSQEHTAVFNPNAFQSPQKGENEEGPKRIPSKKDGIPKIYKFLKENR